jgi:hypothetical protein
MVETPRFLQGIVRFEGRGLENPARFEPPLTYRVPSDRRAQFIYGRIGNPNAELIYILLTRDQRPMRYFPAGAKAGINIQLFVIEDVPPDTEIELLIGAPEGLNSTVIVDFGLIEV